MSDLMERLRTPSKTSGEPSQMVPFELLCEIEGHVVALEMALEGLLAKIEANKDHAGSGYYDLSFHEGDLVEARAALHPSPVTKKNEGE